jgi:transcriptional regulator with XRE-family HTH domain
MPVSDYRFSGAKLRAAREAAGFTREELAVSSGRAAETIRGYEADRFPIPLVVARTFAALLKTDLAGLSENGRGRGRK